MGERVYSGRVSEPMFEGREVVVRGQKFIVPELTIGARRALSPKLKWMYEHFATPHGASAETSFNDLERLHELWFEAAMAALKMNYPDITAETIAENFSLSQIRQCFEAAVGVRPRESRDSADPTQAASSAAGLNQTGAKSTDF